MQEKFSRQSGKPQLSSGLRRFRINDCRLGTRPHWSTYSTALDLMLEYFKTILAGQFEAALCMLGECIGKCPPENWEGHIANDTFRQVAYHTLFFVDLYLSRDERAFELRDVHQRGGDERSLTAVSAGLGKDETLAYLAFCRAKAKEAFSSETVESLQGASGFSWLPFSRGELHLSNIRHVQHHTGQLSAYLRKIVDDSERWWIKTGWR